MSRPKKGEPGYAEFREREKARKAEYARRPEVKARKAEYARRYWAKIVDSYDLHDRKCEMEAMRKRRRKIVNQATPYTPRRGLRVPPSWMRRPCDLYAPGGRGAAGEAFARELFRERREWMHRHNRA